MANAVTAGRPATYEDLLAAPANLVAEILDGELVTSPRPASSHAHAAGVIAADVIGNFHGAGGGGRAGGWWILFEPELHLGPNVIVPDLAGWRHQRMPVFPDTPFFEVPPDWAGEVASPSTVRMDRVRKMDIYARAGVRHLWLVDALAATVEVYRLENGRWTVVGTSGGDTKARLEPFEPLEVDLARWWPPRPATP